MASPSSMVVMIQPNMVHQMNLFMTEGVRKAVCPLKSNKIRKLM